MRLTMIALLLLTGCAPKRPAHVVTIPLPCMTKVKILNFPQGCSAVSASKAVCRQVEIEYQCVGVR